MTAFYTRMDSTQIPDSLEGMNLGNTFYHRGCYQSFSRNQDQLKLYVPDYALTQRSPWKSSSLFPSPPECIVCNKLETKVKGNKSRRLGFYKDGESGPLQDLD